MTPKKLQKLMAAGSTIRGTMKRETKHLISIIILNGAEAGGGCKGKKEGGLRMKRSLWSMTYLSN